MFGSDNQSPAHPAILEAIVAANSGRAESYGGDDWTSRALALVQQIFETDDLDMYLVGTGGAANGLALSLLCPPWGAVLALGDAHVIADEGSGPEHFTSGARMIGIGANALRMTPVHLIDAALRYASSNVQSPQPRAVTISNLSENGLVYRADEVAALSEICRTKMWGLHMDGARFANAIVGSGASPANLTWRAGVDALSFGLTKNGAACAEALIVFGKARDPAGAYLRKRAGHLFSKQRYMACQFVAMLEAGLWIELAGQANAMARGLADVLEAARCKLVNPVEGNEVFACLTLVQKEALRTANIGFYPWVVAGPDVYRFVTCWQTMRSEIEAVRAALAGQP